MPITDMPSNEDDSTVPSAFPVTQQSAPSEADRNLAVDRYIASIWGSIAEKRDLSIQRAQPLYRGVIRRLGDLVVYNLDHCFGDLLGATRNFGHSLGPRPNDNTTILSTASVVPNQNPGDTVGVRRVINEAEMEAKREMPPGIKEETSQYENLNSEKSTDPISRILCLPHLGGAKQKKRTIIPPLPELILATSKSSMKAPENRHAQSSRIMTDLNDEADHPVDSKFIDERPVASQTIRKGPGHNEDVTQEAKLVGDPPRFRLATATRAEEATVPKCPGDSATNEGAERIAQVTAENDMTMRQYETSFAADVGAAGSISQERSASQNQSSEPTFEEEVTLVNDPSIALKKTGEDYVAKLNQCLRKGRELRERKTELKKQRAEIGLELKAVRLELLNVANEFENLRRLPSRDCYATAEVNRSDQQTTHRGEIPPCRSSGTQRLQANAGIIDDLIDATAIDESPNRLSVFESILPLPDLIPVRPNRQNKEVLYSERATLFVLDYAMSAWMRRGRGTVKIARSSNGLARIFMYCEQKLACNHYITSDMRVTQMTKSPGRAVTWTAIDFASDPAVSTTFALKTKESQHLQKFQQVFTNEATLASTDETGRNRALISK